MKKLFLLICGFVIVIACSGCTNILNDNLYPVEQNGKIGFIDYSGKEIAEAKYQSVILNNDEDLIAVKFNNLWGFINKSDKFVIIPQYKSTKGFSKGLAYVVDDNYEGYINKKGEYVWKQPKKTVAAKTQSAAAKSYANVKNDLADSIFKELGL